MTARSTRWLLASTAISALSLPVSTDTSTQHVCSIINAAHVDTYSSFWYEF